QPRADRWRNWQQWRRRCGFQFQWSDWCRDHRDQWNQRYWLEWNQWDWIERHEWKQRYWFQQRGWSWRFEVQHSDTGAEQSDQQRNGWPGEWIEHRRQRRGELGQRFK